MYMILEHRVVIKSMRYIPKEIQKNYVAWKRIVEFNGPSGLRLIKGFHDEALSGNWAGFRSSRLNKQWRVIYKTDRDLLEVYVIEITPHHY